MEEENEAILVAMIIGAVILGIGLSLFFNRPYTGFGAVVLAIGLMTLSLILTMRAEEIIHLRIYPKAPHSETIAEVSVENPSPTESTPEVLEVEETQPVQQVEEDQQPSQEAQQVQEVEETEQPYTPSMYEPSPPQEASFAEHEQEQERESEPEPSIETAPPSSEQSQETEEPQEPTTPAVTTN